MKRLVSLVLTVLLLVVPATALAKTASSQGKTTANVILRSKTSTSGKALMTVSKGKAITILNLSAAKGWYQVQYSGKTGYMSSQYVSVTKTAAAPAKTTTAAKAKATAAPSLDAKSIIGITEKQLTATYGAPARKDPSEYGFQWYVYNKDYKNFFMAGVRSGKVVAFYSNAANARYTAKVVIGTTQANARATMGKPLPYIKSGKTVFLMPNTNERDYFTTGGGSTYIIVFYDHLNKDKTTAIMVVPAADENNALLKKPALSAAVRTAYERQSVDLTNAIRVRNGLKALSTDSGDTKLAQQRSTDMVKRNYFSHYTPDKKTQTAFDIARTMKLKFSSMGENIAYGNHNAIFAQESFMNSQGHRDNLLRSKYTKMGAGVAYGGSRYVLLTNIFSN